MKPTLMVTCYHAAKQRDDESDAFQGGRNILSGSPVNEPEEGEQKREVQINVNAEQVAEFE
jgi:hypothetical protein